ncbi:LLGL domain-containing protein [Aphelenchoides besseyi]|nr:LLGL domain-containing protein [Aphelenchoides besseyi]
MFRFLRRRRQADQDTLEYERLCRVFGISTRFEHGVPYNVHRIAIDSQLGLVAVITKGGLVELYDKNGQKSVLLKKLGSPSTYFEFVEGAHRLLIVCVPSSSLSLPESYYVINTDGAEACSTVHRPKIFPAASCFCISKHSDYENYLFVGCTDLMLNVLNLSSKSLEIEPLISVSELLKDKRFCGRDTNSDFNKFTDVAVTSKFIICCFGHTLIAVICMKTRTLIKTIEMSRRYTAMSLNEDLGHAFFVSTETMYSLSLSDLTVQHRGLEAWCFEKTDYYQVVTSARTNTQLILYSIGIPDRLMQKSAAFNIVSDGELFTFLLSRNATAVILLCEHELISIDLMDPQFRCINLKMLNCVDSSPVTSIRVEQLETDDPIFSTSSQWFSQRRDLFDSTDTEEPAAKQLECVVFTGHENGDIFVWDMRDGSQRLLQMFRVTNYLTTPSSENESEEVNTQKIDEEVNAVELELSTVELNCDKDLNRMQNRNQHPNISRLAISPSGLWREAKSVKIVELGLYDERSEDDRLAIESFSYCTTRQTLVCGLHGGMIVVSTTSNSECDFTNEESNSIKLVEVKTSDIDQPQTNQTPLKYKKSKEWRSSIFIPHLFQLSVLPQTPIRCVSYCEKSCVTVAGTSTGIVVFNSMSGRVVLSRNFLPRDDIEFVLAEEKPLSRFKTVKYSVHKSIWRRSFRMSRTGNQLPKERQVEFRDSQMPVNNGVRCFQFYSTPSNQRFLVVGTAQATVYVFEIDSADSCTLYKEIRLSHRAPIIAIETVKIEKHTRLVVFTEEQIRCYSLEGLSLRPLKYNCKLTAKCGIRLRHASICRSTEDAFQYFLYLMQRWQCFGY